jgi:hypothetical protein
MGADFTLAIVEKPEEGEKEVWRTRLTSLNREDFISMIDDHGCPYFADYDYWDDLEEGKDGEEERYLAYLRKEASDLVDSIYYLAWVNPGRECAWVYLDNKIYLASGGMSWGDSPTEAYDLIVAWDITTMIASDESEKELTSG